MSPERGPLIIGYGNTLRRDDGAGAAVVEAIAALGLPGVRTLEVHQLLPELAEPISEASQVIFVDARTGEEGCGLRLARITPGVRSPLAGHRADPRALLALALQVYGRAPVSWMVAVTAYDLDLGEGLSAGTARGVAEAVALITRHLEVP
jgi:hydrogenase maturation protease